MHRLLEKFSDQLSDELAKNISDSVVKTVEAMFGEKMNVVGNEPWRLSLIPIAINVTLRQGAEEANLRLVFDRNLLSLLLSRIYSPEELANEASLKDAASEIGNIVCNKIKLFLIERGFEVTMGFPVVADSEEQTAANNTLDLKFSLFGQPLQDSRILHVNFI